MVIRSRVEVNVSRGIGLIQEAAEANFIDAILFMAGWCVSKDNIAPTPSDSTFWNEKATCMGCAEGMMRLEQNLLDGIGGASDFPMACDWLERASPKGTLKPCIMPAKRGLTVVLTVKQLRIFRCSFRLLWGMSLRKSA